MTATTKQLDPNRVAAIVRATMRDQGEMSIESLSRSVALYYGLAWVDHEIAIERAVIAALDGLRDAVTCINWTGVAGTRRYTLADAPITVGTRVSFPSKSAPSGSRIGRVIKVSRTTAVVSFRYNYGRESTKTVKLADVRRIGGF